MKKSLRGVDNQEDSFDSLPNPVMVSRQIDELRVVLRRMKSARSKTLDTITRKKVEQHLSN
jgi:hypothetical protein